MPLNTKDKFTKVGYESVCFIHYKLLQRDPNQQQAQGCNCQGGPGTFPLTPAECQKGKVIYVGSVESVDGVEHYTGLTGNTFKKRYY